VFRLGVEARSDVSLANETASGRPWSSTSGDEEKLEGDPK
jgi:hypothetical protein